MHKLLLCILLVPIAAFAVPKEGKYTKNKMINKEFIVTSNATLQVSNKYGNIDIATWDENKIVIQVSITTNGNDEEKVQKRLDDISVDFSESTSLVSAKTIIEKSSNSWNWWGKKNNINMEINYLIKMPVTNNIDLNNDYGAITLDKIEGTTEINCDYGKITIGELLNDKNFINIDYTNKSSIEFMKNGEINADYSGIIVEKSGKIDLNADYSHVAFTEIDILDFNCDYGSLKIENVNSINGNSDYMNITIESLASTGIFDIDYGTLKIESLQNSFEELNLESSYATVKLGVDTSATFSIEATLSYTGFKYDDGFTFNKEIIKSSSKYYKGYYKSDNSSNTITINSSYGNITFSNN